MSQEDTQTEMRIQAAMRELMKDRTCFVIAHRLSTIQNADNILVVQNGGVAEHGTHSQLIQQNDIFAQLFNAQFE